MPKSAWPLSAAAALSLLAGSQVSSAPPWTTFQNAGQLSLEQTVAPEEGAPLGPEVWSTAIPGYGQSSPVLWNGQVYVTSVDGPNREQFHITAYRTSDGQKLWQQTLANPSPRENTSYYSRSPSTPAVDEQGLVCFLEGGILIAFTHDGKVRWERNLVTEFGPLDSEFGVAGSVEQQADRVFVWIERTTDPYILAVDKITGKDLWKVPGMKATSWSSPRLVPVESGPDHLVLSGVGTLEGLDPADGKTLWKLQPVAGNSTPTPIPLGHGRFLIGATDGRGEAAGSKPAESNGVVQITKAADGTWSADYIWRAKRATSSFGSPMATSGHAYFVNRSGVLYCLDLETGEERYAERTGESTWATPIADAHSILLFGKSGTVTAIAKGPEFKTLGTLKVWADEPQPPAAPPAAPPATPPAAERPAAQGERPMAERPAGGRAGGRTGGGSPAAGPTLYGIAIEGDTVLIRRGDRLYSRKFGVPAQ